MTNRQDKEEEIHGSGHDITGFIRLYCHVRVC
jgi:hypothetical protein